MAKTDNILETVVALGLDKTDKAPAQDSAQNRVTALLAARMEREEVERLEDERMKVEVRKQGAKAMQDKRNQELAHQEQCGHMKPWGGPAIGGQKDHKGNFHWICLFCAKTWINAELPINLRIPLERVGGPSL